MRAVFPARLQSTNRVPPPNQQPVVSQPYTFEAPTDGWVTNTNLAQALPRGARVLDNWFPTAKSIRLRAGSLKYATISTGDVTALFKYKSGTVQKFFAADADAVFDITTPASASVIPTAEFSGQTNGDYSSHQFSNSTGDYLFICNGADAPQRYSGSAWADPAFTGTGLSQNDFSFVWSYASRLFFVEKDTQNVWVGGANAIGGATELITFYGVFNKGGSILFGCTISGDSGSGFSERCVFVTDQGEFAVYQGTDPTSASTWSLVGVYQLAKPLGKNCILDAGGDQLVATQDGLVSMISAISNDRDAVKASAVSLRIEPDWLREAKQRRNESWTIARISSLNMAVITIPIQTDGTVGFCYVVNLQTGAWARYTNWNAQVVTNFDDDGYFGTEDGKIFLMESGGQDDGGTYTATWIGSFDDMGLIGATKDVHLGRGIFRNDNPIRARITVNTDYNEDFAAAPNSIDEFSNVTWGSFTWGSFTWGASSDQETRQKRVVIDKSGKTIAPQIRVSSGTTPAQSLECIDLRITFTSAALSK